MEMLNLCSFALKNFADVEIALLDYEIAIDFLGVEIRVKSRTININIEIKKRRKTG